MQKHVHTHFYIYPTFTKPIDEMKADDEQNARSLARDGAKKKRRKANSMGNAEN